MGGAGMAIPLRHKSCHCSAMMWSHSDMNQNSTRFYKGEVVIDNVCVGVGIKKKARVVHLGVMVPRIYLGGPSASCYT